MKTVFASVVNLKSKERLEKNREIKNIMEFRKLR